MLNNRSSALIIIRGLPGSGKSTLARMLSENGKHPVFCIDDYFTDENGNYSFDFSKNHLAYKACEEKVLQAMKDKTQKIFVDNTFTLDWEMEPYFKLAAMHDYSVFVLTTENYHGSKNVHGISEEQLRKMAEKYKVKLLP